MDRHSARDHGLRRIGRLTRMVVVAALAATGALAAGFSHAVQVPHPQQSTGSRQDDGTGLRGPAQAPAASQAPPVSVSGGS